MKSSLQKRIIRSMWILSSLTALTAILVSTYLVLRVSDQWAEEKIRSEEANIIELGLVDLISLNDFQEVLPRLPELFPSDRLSEIIRIYNTSGELLFTSVKVPDFASVAVDRGGSVNKGFYKVTGKKRSYLAFIRSHVTLDGEKLWIEIATVRPSAFRIVQMILIPFSILLLFLFSISLWMAKQTTKKILAPLHSMSDQVATMNIDETKMWQPIHVEGEPKEFSPITQKINSLLIRIQSLILKLHQWSRFIAHEIRTPLTVIRGEIETEIRNPTKSVASMESVLKSSLDEVDKMESIVETVLRLSRAEKGGTTFQPKSVDLVDYLESIIPQYEKLLSREIETKFSSPNISAYVDPNLFGLILSNLFRNIAKHTSNGVKVGVEVSELPQNKVEIKVLDEGEGLPPDADQKGLGLQLCKQIAEVSGIELHFSNREVKGLEVKMGLSKMSS